MFQITLAVHNVLRWVVIGVALWSLVQAYRGWLGGREWARQDALAGRLLISSFDLQFLVGLFLTVFSPLIQAAIDNPEAIMGSATIRFFTVEHVPLMILVLIGLHVTNSVVKRASDDVGRHRRAAIGYSVGVLLMMLAIPWWRPLLPGL